MTQLLIILNFGTVMLYGITLALSFCGISPRRYPLKYLCYFLCFSVVQALLFAMLGPDILFKLYPFFTHIPLFLLLIFLEKEQVLFSGIAVLSAYLFCSPRKWIGTLVSSFFSYDPRISQLVQIAITIPLLLLILYVVTPYVVRLRAESSKTLKLVIAIPAFYYVLEYALAVYSDLFYTGGAVIVEFLDTVLVVVYFFFTIVYLKILTEKTDLEKELLTSRLLEDGFEKEIHLLEELKQQSTLYRHDLRQHLRLISSYLEEHNEPALRDYLKDLGESLPVSKEEIYCQNHAANTIVSYYVSQAKSQGICVQSDLIIPNDFSISDKDLCVLLGNLLENATEACLLSKASDTAIEIKSEFLGTRKFVLIVDNYPAEKPSIQNGKFLSTKDGNSRIGVGTESIRAIVRKNHGDVRFDWEDNCFRVSIIFTLPA